MAERKHGALSGRGAVDELVDAARRAVAGLHDLGDRFVSEKRAAFGVNDFAGLEENYSVGIVGVDVQRAGLAAPGRASESRREDRDAKGCR